MLATRWWAEPVNALNTCGGLKKEYGYKLDTLAKIHLNTIFAK